MRTFDSLISLIASPKSKVYVVFGSSVSLMATVTVLSFASTFGVILGVGEINKLAWGLSIWTNSLNISVILFPSKFREESGGVTDTSKGGSESRSPPVGGTMLAQPVVPDKFARRRSANKKPMVVVKTGCFIIRVANLKALLPFVS